MAHDGKAKAIIAMPSVTVMKDGTMISKVVPYIDHGAAVTTSRCDADYIVTEDVYKRQVRDVMLDTSVSEDLLDMARKILSGEHNID